ncbi:MAG: hypothetical protein HC887_12140 [Desulfobacteraceae bacterium]|nr:hypothetical protein [Desulfobacteraceae bacterium]
MGEIITSGMNDEQKVKAVHDWVVKNVQYDTSLVRHSAYEGLYSKTTVCQGYALLMFRMLKDSGINGRIVSGGNHAWNLLYLCGNYYHLDATWDDPVPDVPNRVLYNYYNKSDSYMASIIHGLLRIIRQHRLLMWKACVQAVRHTRFPGILPVRIRSGYRALH